MNLSISNLSSSFFLVQRSTSSALIAYNYGNSELKHIRVDPEILKGGGTD